MEGYHWTRALLVFLAFVVGLGVAVKVATFVVVHQLQIPALVLAMLFVIGLTVRIDRQVKKESTQQE